MSTITKTAAFLPNHPFWHFSCQIYHQAKHPLLALQDRHSLNINVLLLCQWLAATNQGTLSKSDFKKLLVTITTWHERIVLPLRNLRNRLQHTVDAINLPELLIEEALSTELVAEHIEQLLMADRIAKKPLQNRKTNFQRALHACQNTATYCQIVYVNLDNGDCELFANLLKIIFTDLNNTELLDMCRTVLLTKKKSKELASKQMQLQLLEE